MHLCKRFTRKTFSIFSIFPILLYHITAPKCDWTNPAAQSVNRKQIQSLECYHRNTIEVSLSPTEYVCMCVCLFNTMKIVQVIVQGGGAMFAHGFQVFSLLSHII